MPNSIQDIVSISLRTSPHKAEILAELAKKQDRSRNHLINQAIDTYIEMYNEWIEGVEKAKEEINAGKSIPIEKVFSKFED